MRNILIVVLAFLNAGCALRGPERIGEENPTVAYRYHRGEGDEVRQRAAKYCYETYSRSARVMGDTEQGNDRVITFECIATL